MGWSQTRHAPARLGRQEASVVRAHETADLQRTFVDPSRLRTVFIMNDELLRHGLAHVLSQAIDIQFVGDLQHDAELVERLRALQPDLLVVADDPNLPLSALLAALDPAPKVVAVIDSDGAPSHAVELIRAGADALVDRRSPADELLSTVLHVIDGRPALDARSTNTLVSELRSHGSEPSGDYSRMLTRREAEVLSLLTDGLDNRAIAAKLFVAEATVKFHLHNIMGKFGVHKRAALVSAALGGNRGRSDGYPQWVR